MHWDENFKESQAFSSPSMIFKNVGKERKSGLVSLLLKNWDLAPGMPWTSSKTRREAAELTPNPEHS